MVSGYLEVGTTYTQSITLMLYFSSSIASQMRSGNDPMEQSDHSDST